MASANCNKVPKANIVYPEHKTELVENLWKCLAERELLDLVFICDKNIKVFAHKLVFATVSQFLSKIININSQDVVYVSVPDVDHKRLRILVKFLYEGVARVSYEEMIYLRELMVLLDVEIKNSEIKLIDSFTPICVKDIEQTDPLTAEDPLKVRPTSIIVPKVESNTDYFSIEAGNKDFVSFAGNVNMSTTNIMNTDFLKKEAEDSDNMDKDILKSEINTRIRTVDNDKKKVTNIDIEEEENKVIDLSSDNDSDVVECADNDSVMETVPCRGQGCARMVLREKSSKQVDVMFHNKGISSEYRTTFSKQQKSVLENAYIKNKFPGSATASSIAKTLGLSKRSVIIWFKNRRAKDKAGCTPMVLREKSSKQVDVMFHNKGISSEYRTTFSKQQKSVLENAYIKNKFPGSATASRIADTLGLPKKSVIIWFKNRRAKDKAVSQNKKDKNSQENFRKYHIEESTEESQDSRYSCGTNESRSGEKRSYYCIGSNQKEILNAAYVKEKYPSKKTMKTLEKKLGLPVLKIRMWFATRRQRDSSVIPLNKAKRVLGNSRRFSEGQRRILEAQYKKEKYPSPETLKKLQKELHLPMSKIKNWFSYVRYRDMSVCKEGRNRKTESRSDIKDGNAEDTQHSRDLCESNDSNSSEVVYPPLLMSVDEDDDDEDNEVESMKNCQGTENYSSKKMTPTINKFVPVREEGKNGQIESRSDIIDGDTEGTQDSRDMCEINDSSRSAVVYSPLLMCVDDDDEEEEDDEVETMKNCQDTKND